MGIQIITESSCDIPQEEAKNRRIKVLPLSISFGEEEYLDGITINSDEFFNKLKNSDEFPHTSQLSPEKYREAFKEAIDNGDEVICITLSNKLSGSHSNALIAQEEFNDKVTIIDSSNVSIGQHILLDLATRLRDQNLTKDKIVDVGDNQILTTLSNENFIQNPKG